jgi:nitrite reductase/ring-hydroxylating ferredoxin subunit
MKVPLCKLEEIPDEGTKTVGFFGRDVLVFKANGNPKAVLNFCMHLGGPMQRDGNRLVCQWHGAEFDRHHGKALKGPAHPDSRLITLPTRIEDGVLTYVYGE